MQQFYFLGQESPLKQFEALSNWHLLYQKLAALKLIKECHEAVFHLVDSGPSIMYLKQLQERLILIENRQVH